MSMLLGLVAAMLILVGWVVMLSARKKRLQEQLEAGVKARLALTDVAEKCQTLDSVTAILNLTTEFGDSIFGATRVVTFESADGGEWDVIVPGAKTAIHVPAAMKGLFSWFKHNSF